MKTTLDLADELLTRMIEEGLVLRLRRPRSTKAAPLEALPVSPQRGGLRPGIDATRNQSMLDAAAAE